jgi:Ran GTPase-activating protein (RanGAP) involved in mRNA processing and transport/GTPase SAR1 family protein
MDVTADAESLLQTHIKWGKLCPAEKRQLDSLIPKVSRVDLEGKDLWAGEARALARTLGGMAGLTSLELGKNHIWDEGVQALAGTLGGMAGLTSLGLGNNLIGAEGAQALAEALSGMAGLTSLQLECNQIGPEGARALAGALGSMTGLTSLGLGSNDIRAEGARALAGALEGMGGLTSLGLGSNWIEAKGAQALAGALGGMVGLTSLELECNQIGPEGARALAGALGGMTGLTSLGLGSNRIEAKGAQALAGALGGMVGLTSLELECNQIGPEGARPLAGALGGMTGLTSLGLGSNWIWAKGAQALAGALGGMVGLTSLELGGNHISDEGAQALGEVLIGMVGLTSLGLRSNGIGAQGARALAGALGGMARLTSLGLGGNDVGDGGARALAGALGGMARLITLKLELSREDRNEFLAWLEGNVKVEANFIETWFAEPGQLARAREILKRNQVISKRAGQWMAFNEEMVQPSAAKIVFCGNGEVGKTTLRQSMERAGLRRAYADGPSMIRTKGIEVRRLEVEGISLMLWDMAGQSEFHVFHSTFLAERHIVSGKATMCFLVVRSTFTGFEDAKRELQYWLRFIASAQPKVAEGSVGRERVEVVVVVNCWEGERNFAALYESWAEVLMEEERRKYAGRIRILTPTVLDVRGFRKGEIDGLLSNLSERLKTRLESYGACVPSTCVRLALQIEELRLACGDLPLMEWFTFQEQIAKTEFGEIREAPKGWETKLKYAVEYLHDVGQIVYFEKRELVILDPHWICYRMVGDLLLPDQLRDQFANLLKPRNGSVELKALQSWYEATLRLKDRGISGADVVDLLEWLSLCYRERRGGSEEKVVIPALLTEDSLGDAERCWMKDGGGIIVGRRMKCKEEELTLLSANYFQRLQADLALGEDGVSGIGRGWVFLTKPHRLVPLQYDVGRDCIDILVKQYKTDPQMEEEEMYEKAMGCLELFASSVYEGCAKVKPGVSLVESVIIPWAFDALRSIDEREIKGVSYLQDLLLKDGTEDARLNLSLGGVNDTVRVVYLLHQRETEQDIRPKGKYNWSFSQQLLFEGTLEMLLQPQNRFLSLE